MFVYELRGAGFESSCSHLTTDFAPPTSKKLLDIEATIEYEVTPKSVRDMTRTYSQMYRRDKCSQHNSIIWPVWVNYWLFVYEKNGCGARGQLQSL